MGFATTQYYVDQINNGSIIRSSFHKVFNSFAAATAGRWYDMSMMVGDPQNNFYSSSSSGGLSATQLNYLSSGNFWHGGSKSPQTKHLKSALIYSTAATTAPCVFLLCDYLLYYPRIQTDMSTSIQTFDNTITLPRYTTGEGVKMFLVARSDVGSVASSIIINYQNSDGVDNQVTGGTYYTPSSASFPLNLTASSPITSLVNTTGTAASYFGPFIPLFSGDHGVRKVNSVQILTGMGGGMAALVLVKPLAYIPFVTVSVPSERDYLVQIPSLPRIYDGAFLSLLMMAGAAVPVGGASIYQGYMEYVFG